MLLNFTISLRAVKQQTMTSWFRNALITFQNQKLRASDVIDKKISVTLCIHEAYDCCTRKGINAATFFSQRWYLYGSLCISHVKILQSSKNIKEPTLNFKGIIHSYFIQNIRAWSMTEISAQTFHRKRILEKGITTASAPPLYIYCHQYTPNVYFYSEKLQPYCYKCLTRIQ